MYSCIYIEISHYPIKVDNFEVFVMHWLIKDVYVRKIISSYDLRKYLDSIVICPDKFMSKRKYTQKKYIYPYCHAGL